MKRTILLDKNIIAGLNPLRRRVKLLEYSCEKTFTVFIGLKYTSDKVHNSK